MSRTISPLYRPVPYPSALDGAFGWGFAVREAESTPPQKPRLLDRVRQAVRTRHYSRRTEKAYVDWTRRYILFHHKRHPVDMGADEVTAFLTWLAVHGRVAASTQNQALSALLFLYREVLRIELPHAMNRGPAAVRSPADRDVPFVTDMGSAIAARQLVVDSASTRPNRALAVPRPCEPVEKQDAHHRRSVSARSATPYKTVPAISRWADNRAS